MTIPKDPKDTWVLPVSCYYCDAEKDLAEMEVAVLFERITKEGIIPSHIVPICADVIACANYYSLTHPQDRE